MILWKDTQLKQTKFNMKRYFIVETISHVTFGWSLQCESATETEADGR